MKRTLIIAEAGVNHNGSLETAKSLIRAAKECGADVIKFQTAKLESLVSKSAPMAEYQMKNTGVKQSQKEMLRKLLLPFDDFHILSDCCKEFNIQFLSTPFDIDSIHFLNSLQDIWKVPSGEITDYPYLVEIAKTGKEVILSTGMSEMNEIHEAVDLLWKQGAKGIRILHCTTNYPTPMEEVNLNVLNELKDEFHCPVGYSDHTKGIEISIAAVAMGASVVEKHLTLDRNMPGPDHKASLEPYEFKNMVQAIRNIEIAKGSGVKTLAASEQKNRKAARKSIVAAKKIKAGEIFTIQNLTTKRPGTGISPMRWNEVIGTRASRDFEEDELITL